jgi:hypothetical protein
MNLKNPHIVWAAVAIVFMLIAGAVTLTALGRDPGIILTLTALVAVPVLGAFGAVIYQKVDQTKEIANGNMSRMLTQLLAAHKQSVDLAMQVPPAEPEKPTQEF